MLKAKKSLGQHFLTNAGIVGVVAEAASVSEDDTVLEIGPGKGILTEELLRRGAKVVAIEKDSELLPLLQEKFEKEIKSKHLTLIHGDILKFSPDTLAKKYKIVANIPYYITGQIMRKFLEAKHKPVKMSLLVQKEVAERIVAKDGKESLLSISVKTYGVPRYIQTVKAGSFSPAPKVDSAILLIDNISDIFFAHTSQEQFFEILHAGFAHKRKQLQGNLKAVFDQNVLKEKMKKCGISENERAENLSVEEWKCLSH